MKHETNDLRRRVDEVLLEGGDLYSFEDILEAVHAGDMQSFAHNESWIVTQIGVFPRRVTVNIVFAVGSEEDMFIIHDQIEEFARKQGIDLLTTDGRDGWRNKAKAKGWKRVGSVYMKELTR